jgi:hypothetical protein
MKMEVDETGSVCVVAVFGICGVGPLDSAMK